VILGALGFGLWKAGDAAEQAGNLAKTPAAQALGFACFIYSIHLLLKDTRR